MKKVGRFASEVYRIISGNSHITAGEAFEIYRARNPQTIRSRNEVAKRISDLQKLGLVVKVNTTTCAYTGSQATTWDITGVTEGIVFSEKSPEKDAVARTVFQAVNTQLRFSPLAAPDSNPFGESYEEETLEKGTCCCDDCVRELEAVEEAEENEEEDEEAFPSISSMSRPDKAERLSDIAGEPVVAMDVSDELFLRQCRRALDALESRPIVRMLAKSMGLNGKIEQLKRALRYF